MLFRSIDIKRKSDITETLRELVQGFGSRISGILWVTNEAMISRCFITYHN